MHLKRQVLQATSFSGYTTACTTLRSTRGQPIGEILISHAAKVELSDMSLGQRITRPERASLGGPIPVVEGDPDRLQQVGLIPLDNQLEHTPRWAGASCCPPRGYERSAVGRGHRRVDTARAPRAHLRSLLPHRPQACTFDWRYLPGLAIANSLMVAHAGGIELTSRHGAGTRATIWLPIKRATRRFQATCARPNLDHGFTMPSATRAADRIGLPLLGSGLSPA